VQVVVDMPEGTSLEATARVLEDVARPYPPLPEVTVDGGLCRHLGAVQLQRPGAALFPARARNGRPDVTLLPKDERDRSSHDVALDLREKLKALPLPAADRSRWSKPRRDRR
jgi:hypothetical protein